MTSSSPRDRPPPVALRLLRETKGFAGRIVLLATVSLLGIPLMLLLPIPFKIAIDNILGGQPLPAGVTALLPSWMSSTSQGMLVLAVTLTFAIALLQQVQKLAASLLQVSIGENLNLRFRSRLLGHLERLSLTYHNTRGVSDSLYRVQYDATAVDQMVNLGIIPLLTSTLTVLGMVYIIARIDLALVVVALLVAPLLALLITVMRRRMRQRWTDTKDRESAAMAVVQEVLSNLRVVVAFGQEDRELRRYGERAQRGIRAHVGAVRYESLFGLLLGMAVAGGNAAVLAIGTLHVQSGLITLGELIVVIWYLATLYQPLESVGTTIATLQQSLASAQRAYEILDQAPDVSQRPDAVPVSRAQGQIEFRDVSFTYDDTQTTLRQVSFAAEAGSLVGVIGQTGAGKSTLINLLPRFYDVTSGAVLLDGVDLRDIQLEDLRRQFAMVPQEPVLFSTTIAENIAYGHPEASPAAVEAAARAANAHDFISALPQGYGTQVGERGLRLSGGERQRISLARAFLRDSPLLILDEPTSAIDVETEGLVMDALQRLVQGRTTFLVTHRLDTLRGADLTLVLDQGRLVRIEPGDPSTSTVVLADVLPAGSASPE